MTIVVKGELGYGTGDQAIAAAAPHMTAGTNAFVDCSGVTFVDSRGLLAIVQLERIATESGATFALTGITAPLARLLSLTGLTNYFDSPS